MRNELDVEKHRLSRGINALAKTVLEKNYSTEMIKTEIEHRFLHIPRKDRDSLFTKVVERCYINAWLVNEAGFSLSRRSDNRPLSPDFPVSEAHVRKSPAMLLARHLVDRIARERVRLSRNSGLAEDFFDRCLATDSRRLRGIADDSDLMLIYLKQMAIILKQAKIIVNRDGYATISAMPDRPTELYAALFTAFWKTTRWDALFPSMPGFACTVKKNKNILIDLMLKQSPSFSVQSVGQDFLDLTGAGEGRTMICLSFLDFYFFTWMKHFGLLQAVDGAADASVCFTITVCGRRMMEHLQ